MNIALKEWAVICRALGVGRQMIIIRKGGIHEEGGKFRPEFTRFLLFPTGFHQTLDQVVPGARDLLPEALGTQQTNDQLVLSHYAEAFDVFRLGSLAALRRLRDMHIWSDAVVEHRFHRWEADTLHVLVVRVFELAQPASIAVQRHYGGCKSWVRLDEDITTDDARPVLTAEVFEDRRQRIVQAVLDAV